MKQYKVAILGATGAVGREMMKILAERDFPVAELHLLASERSVGQLLPWKGQDIAVELACDEAFKGMDIVLGAAENDIAKRFAPAIVKAGAVFVGILNGIDVVGYDPETDSNLKKHYSVTKIAGKKECRAALLHECGLTDSDAPVVGIVTRFVAHKGIQLVQQTFQEMLQLGCRFVVLGSGERLYEDFFREMQAEYPDQVHVTVGFVPAMARRIYGGADIFLMPSQNEPCGLAQMVAMRYGTIPVVRETGGLKDSVFDAGGKNGNGFTFKTYDAYDMLDAVKRSCELFADKRKWNALVRHAMKCDYSWNVSAEKYVELYRSLLG